MTPDRSQLPHLVRLLDDDTPEVRLAVVEHLSLFGEDLPGELERQGLAMTPDQLALVRGHAASAARARLRREWGSWMGKEGDKEKLEAALTLIADYQCGGRRPGALSRLLDTLAEEFRTMGLQADVRGLSEFLFAQKQLAGAKDDYYNPRNSDLVYVIEKKRGIPISLALVFMLVGHRLGMAIDGCNFPGHFLAMTFERGDPLIIDCFHGGLLINDTLLARYLDPVTVTVRDLLNLRSDVRSIIARVLRNLINAYRAAGEQEDLDLMLELLAAMPGGDEPPS
jgi:regulator of sirC expression with transglutaminase-like and TPR domain